MAVMDNQKLQFSSSTENLTLVETLVDDVCEEYKINEDFYGNILVALTEAVTNAIQHGNKYDPDKKVSLGFVSEKDKISFSVKDEGEGFDYNDLPDPTDPENLEKPNGRGIFLMRHLADEIEFHEDGRIVELNFNLGAN